MNVEAVGAAKLIRDKVDNDMANGIAQELRVRGYEPRHFTLLAYGGNGALHACGIANMLGVSRVMVPPFTSIFSAIGAGNMDQLHFHERSLYLSLYDSNTRALFDDFPRFNALVEELEQKGKDDLLRQGVAEESIQHRLELDMRYGNQLAQTAVVVSKNRLNSAEDLLEVMKEFSADYGRRYGEGSQAPEAGIRVNTIRVATYSSMSTLKFQGVLPDEKELTAAPAAKETRDCHFVGHDAPLATGFYELADLDFGAVVEAPAVVISPSTTYLVEPGWKLRIGRYGAGLFMKAE